jgi:RNA polymerase sigma factor (sigma-70 family)
VQVTGSDRVGRGDDVIAAVPAVARAFEQWVSPYLAVMRAVAVREVGAADGDDLVQDALIRAWRRRETFRPDRGSIKSWLIAILMDQARRRRTRLRDPRLHHVPYQGVSGPEDGDRLDVEDAIRRLPMRQRQVVTMFYLADLPIDEVAAVLSLRPGSVKAHLARARETLRTLLETQ